MAGYPQVLLVGERDLLVTVASPSPEASTLPRSLTGEPATTAALALEPDLVVVFGPQPGELDAMRQAGLAAAAWPHEWLPVADELFVDEPPTAEPARIFFSGAASGRRDDFLQPVKHRFDVLHLAGGADLGELKDLMGRCSAAINLAPEPGLPEVDRIGPALASGMLVIAEAPVGRPGLGDWQELVTFSTPDELSLLIADLLREPEPFLEVRRRGRSVAEAWRSSAVLPEFVAQALA